MLVEPTQIQASNAIKELRISWSDGHDSRYPYDYLRGYCPCAACQGHRVAWEFVPNDAPVLTVVAEVGNYALNLHFADDHKTGIYSFDILRTLCPCDACRRTQGETHPWARRELAQRT
jgi:DUF971 family protein